MEWLEFWIFNIEDIMIYTDLHKIMSLPNQRWKVYQYDEILN